MLLYSAFTSVCCLESGLLSSINFNFFLVVEMILFGFPKLCGSMNLWAQL